MNVAYIGGAGTPVNVAEKPSTATSMYANPAPVALMTMPRSIKREKYGYALSATILKVAGRPPAAVAAIVKK